MLVMRSILRKHRLEAAWVVFAAVNLLVMPHLGDWETVPFHFVWVSLTLLYGLRVWRPSTTAVVLGAVCVTTGYALVQMADQGEVTAAELTEVPLMAAMFVAMVWHARRRQAAVEELRRTSEREREFIRDASHQLRTPITIARIHAELIREANDVTAAHDDAVVVLDELTTLGTIAERLLLLAAAEHADFLVRRPVDAEELVVSVARRWAVDRSRRWLIGVGVDGMLECDRDRVAEALDALVENALKFTREEDQIAIRAFGDNGDAVIEVADTGIGISPDDLGRIFERFAVVQDEPKHGTGLGLSIAKTIVEAHGGSISVASAPGKGSTFRIRLPGLRSLDAPTPAFARTAVPLGAPAPEVR